jgi:hypothetical protein
MHELAIYALAYPVYFLLQNWLVFPWAMRTFAYGGQWSDYRYSISLSADAMKRSILQESIFESFNAWNAFSAVDLSWAFAAIVLLASVILIRRRWRSGARLEWFSPVFVAAGFAVTLGPLLVASPPGIGLRMLVGPLLLVVMLVMWSLWTLFDIDWARAPQVGSALTFTIVAWTSISLLAAGTVATGIHRARQEIECLESVVENAPEGKVVVLIEGVSHGNGLRQEFGLTAFGDGPLSNFGIEVVRDLHRRGRIDTDRARHLVLEMDDFTPAEMSKIGRPPHLEVLDFDRCAEVLR